MESTVADDIAFAELPQATQDLVFRLYGGTPDDSRRALADALAFEDACHGECEEAVEAIRKLDRVQEVLDR